MQLVKWWLTTVLLGSALTSCTTLEVDWRRLKQELNGSGGSYAAGIIVQHWSERPVGFFKDIKKEEGWDRIIPLLSLKRMGEIRKEEFEDNFGACRAFAKHLPTMLGREFLNEPLRLAIYTFLKGNFQGELIKVSETFANEMIEEDLAQSMARLDLDRSVDKEFCRGEEEDPQIPAIIGAIPASWAKQDGRLLMYTLVSSPRTPRLGLLGDAALALLFGNPENACALITLDSLRGLDPQQLKLMTPPCMAAIKGLASMDISFIVAELPNTAFKRYNGALTRETIESLSGPQLRRYGLGLGRVTICTLLELHYTSESAFAWVTSRCLYGYLSQEWKGRLGTRWSKVGFSTVNSFTKEMRASWTNIHPEEFAWMAKPIRQIFLGEPRVCAGLDPKYVCWRVMQEVSGPCLYMLLSRQDSSPKVKLRWLWGAVQLQFAAFFSEEMMQVIKNIDGSDFAYMSPFVLSKILKSPTALNSLPQPIDSIILSKKIGYLGLARGNFAAIAKVAPNVAGQLLLSARWLPNNILADCDGETLRSLTCNIPGQTRLDWTLLFAELEERKRHCFPKFLSFMCQNTPSHLCGTIKDLEEYHSLAWLRRNMNETCRLAIKFDQSGTLIFLRAPELARGVLPWQEMLAAYSADDWKEIFSKNNLAAALGKACEFWAVISEQWQDLLNITGEDALKRISPFCVQELHNFLRKNVKYIPLLADDAFATHQVGSLPCDLRDLSPRQLAKVSTDIVAVTRHVLAGATLEELKLLNLTQLKSLLPLQWKFIGESIRHELVSWWLGPSILLLEEFVASRDQVESRRGWNTTATDGKSYLEAIIIALDVYLALGRDSQKGRISLYLESAIPIFHNSELRMQFIKVLSQYFSPRVLPLSVAGSVGELEECIRRSVSGIKATGQFIVLHFDQQAGFDRSGIIAFLESNAKVFADPRARIVSKGLDDHGGPMRLLVSQVLSDILRDLVVYDAQLEGHKFVWGISQEMGMIVGLFLGKAVQTGVRLPFALHLPFYNLLIHNTDRAIERYYYATYGRDLADFASKVKIMRGLDDLPSALLLEVLPRLEHLCFTRLSVEADGDKAKADFASKTNIYGCREGEGFASMAEVSGDQFLEEYGDGLEQMVLTQFKGFVRGLVNGMGHTIPVVKEFATMPIDFLYPFAKFLPELLNVKSVTAEYLVERIIISGYSGGTVLFQEEEGIPISRVLHAFITSLNEGELAHLVGIWSGASTLALENVKLEATFLAPDNRTPVVQLDFCNADDLMATKNKLMVRPGQQYKMLFGKFSEEILGTDSGLEPDCPAGGIKFNPIRVSTCAKSLAIYLQSVQEMFNSLVDLLNTPLTFIKDDA